MTYFRNVMPEGCGSWRTLLASPALEVILFSAHEELLLYAPEERAEIHLWRQRSSDTDDNLLFLVIHCHKERSLVHLCGRNESEE